MIYVLFYLFFYILCCPFYLIFFRFLIQCKFGCYPYEGINYYFNLLKCKQMKVQQLLNGNHKAL